MWSEPYRQEVASFWPWSLLSTQAWPSVCTVGELGPDWMLDWKKPLSFEQNSAPSSFWEGSHFLFSITVPAPFQRLFFLTRASLGATKPPDGWAGCCATGLLFLGLPLQPGGPCLVHACRSAGSLLQQIVCFIRTHVGRVPVSSQSRRRMGTLTIELGYSASYRGS